MAAKSIKGILRHFLFLGILNKSSDEKKTNGGMTMPEEDLVNIGGDGKLLLVHSIYFYDKKEIKILNNLFQFKIKF